MQIKHTINDQTGERHQRKYDNAGLLHRLVLRRFLDTLGQELSLFRNARTLDFGCGEAYFWEEMRVRGLNMAHLTGVDLRDDALKEARTSFPQHEFFCQDLLTWKPGVRYELVVASQVLEHLPEPDRFLSRLVNLTVEDGHLLLTVPWEPYFMLANLARGRDIRRLGNHPEHVNLWSHRGFRKFVAKHASIERVKAVFPFTIILARPRRVSVD